MLEILKIYYYLFYRTKIFFPKKSYSLLGEDVFINDYFKTKSKGFYIDVGCYHPYKGSLTYKLYKRNWSGLNIDISKISKDLFELSRKKDINLNLAVTDYDGEIFYYENSPINQQNSTIENPHAKKIEVDCFKLNTILDKYQIKRIDYLNIDAEGNDFKVISTFDFKRFKPLLVSIEFNDYDSNKLLESDIHILMKNNNYKLISKFGVTCFYVEDNTVLNIHDMMKI